MVKRGIVLGHIISSKGIEVDNVNMDLIANLPLLSCVKDIPPFLEYAAFILSFLGYAGFYRRFIKEFSKVASPYPHF